LLKFQILRLMNRLKLIFFKSLIYDILSLGDFMSKTSLSIQMLNYLYGRNKVSKAELSQVLETNERNIIEYKKELIDAGYDISYTPGRYGGYSLDKNSLFHSINLTDFEKKILLEASNYLANNKEFLHGEEFSLAIGKILSNSRQVDSFEKINIERFPLIMPKKDLKDRYDALDNAINLNLKVYLKYRSLKNVVRESLFNPYALYSYNDSWYVIGFYEDPIRHTLSYEPYYLKLNRIVDYKVTKDKFRPIITFDLNKYLDKMGMSKNGKLYHIKLLLRSPQSFLASERVFGENQQITELDSSHIILECDMRNLDNIISFINYFGDSVKVLEPKEIRNMVIDTQKKMLVNEGVYKKTVFFDFNGTIIDDLDLCLNILNEMLAKKGLNPISKERYRDIFTFPIKDYYIEAGFDFSKYSFEDLSKEFIVKYQKPSLSCPLHEGIVDILKKLREDGYNVVLLTASKKSNVIEQLQSFDILKYFNEVLGIDDIYASSKVQIGLDYMKNYEINPKDAIMVGDTLHDAKVASEMGIDVLLYSKGHQSRKRLETSNKKVIDNLSEIFKYI